MPVRGTFSRRQLKLAHCRYAIKRTQLSRVGSLLAFGRKSAWSYSTGVRKHELWSVHSLLRGSVDRCWGTGSLNESRGTDYDRSSPRFVSYFVAGPRVI